jgi:hypothetical protein
VPLPHGKRCIGIRLCREDRSVYVNIQISNNFKNDVSVEKNITTSQPKQTSGLLGLGGILGFGGGADIGNYDSEGIKIIIPKNTIYSFLNMSDKNNRNENINNFISSIKDVELLNNFRLKEKTSYIKNLQNIMYSTKGGEKKTRKKRGQYKRTRKNKKHK